MNTRSEMKNELSPSAGTASRGSQAGGLSSLQLLRWESLRGNKSRCPKPRAITGNIEIPNATVSNKGYGPVRSRLVSFMTILQSNAHPAKRRCITHTNRPTGSIPTQVSATECDLKGLALGPLPPPNAAYSAPNGDLVIEHYETSKHTYAGVQSEGISEPPPQLTTMKSTLMRLRTLRPHSLVRRHCRSISNAHLNLIETMSLGRFVNTARFSSASCAK